MRIQWLGLLAPVILLAGCDFSQDDKDKAAPSPPAEVAATQIDGDFLTTGGDGTNWAAIGFNYYEQRFSPLSAINRSNVEQLGVDWTVDLLPGQVPQSTPLAVDGKIYITAPRSRVVAFDAATGEQLWSFNAGLAQPGEGQKVTGVGNQGLAIWKGRLYVGTLDGQLIALDAITGAQLWSIQTGTATGQYRITSAPRIVKNMVIIGSGRAADGGRGYVSAYDTTDGALRWRFYTVPKADGSVDQSSSDAVLGTARQTWGGAALGAAAGGYVTDAVTYDPDLDRLYVGVGAGPGTAPDGGDRLFLSSIVALNPDDGEFLWHYQETPGGRPAYGANQPFVLADLPVRAPQPKATPTPGSTPSPAATPTAQPTTAPANRKVLLHASDNGFFFVIDRTNGKLISATPLFDQQRWADGYDLQTGRPLQPGQPGSAAQASNNPSSDAAPASRNARQQTATTGRPAFPLVDPARAPRWMSFNPQTGLIYFTLPKYSAQASGETTAGSDASTDAKQPRWSRDGAKIVAFDPVTATVRWQRDLSVAQNGSPLSTAGGLVFLGTGIGRLVALDAATGETLYNQDLGSGILSAPSTFLIEGVQYIAVTTGFGATFDWPAPQSARGNGESAADDSDASEPAGWLLRVPARARLVMLRIGGSTQLPAVPRARPSPVPTPQSTPGSAPSPQAEPARP